MYVKGDTGDRQNTQRFREEYAESFVWRLSLNGYKCEGFRLDTHAQNCAKCWRRPWIILSKQYLKGSYSADVRLFSVIYTRNLTVW